MSQRRALCIGIDAYAGRNRLGGCVNDTKKWSKFFTDRKFQVTVLTDQQATFDGIVTAIKTLIDSAVSGDIVAIHFSGHGTRVPDTSKQEVDGKDEALVPIDFGTKGFIVDDLIGPCKTPPSVTSRKRNPTAWGSRAMSASMTSRRTFAR